jgi:hypothetical protein
LFDPVHRLVLVILVHDEPQVLDTGVNVLLGALLHPGDADGAALRRALALALVVTTPLSVGSAVAGSAAEINRDVDAARQAVRDRP